MSEVTFTRTRQSIGSQLAEALDDMKAKGAIDVWGISTAQDGRLSYYVEGPRVYFPLFTPGELMDWLNERGYDVRFGKA